MEPTITINGHRLTEPQATTVRVALESFLVDLRENGLGEDERGMVIASSYVARIHEIRAFIFGGQP